MNKAFSNSITMEQAILLVEHLEDNFDKYTYADLAVDFLSIAYRVDGNNRFLEMLKNVTRDCLAAKVDHNDRKFWARNSIYLRTY